MVATASQYIADVCIFCKSSIEQEVTDEVRQILERIKFSKHPLQEEEKEIVCQCMDGIVDEKWKQQSFGKKLIMMFWKCLK